MRQNRVVPVTMELGSFDPQGLHLGIADFDTRGILARVQRSLNTQSLRSRRGANETDNDLPTLQGLPPPISGDVAEHAVLDLVPLAGARGQMADTDAQATLIGEALQCPLPQPRAGTIAATTVSRDQQLRGLRIHRRTHLEPPGTERRYREGRRVMVHADTDPADVRVQVVDTDRRSLAVGVPLASTILEVAHEFLRLLPISVRDI